MNPRRLPARFASDIRGGLAVLAGLSVPVALLGAAAAVEYGNLSRRHGQLQKAVDAAALTAAQQLRLANNSDVVIDSIARDVVARTAPPPEGTTTEVSTNVGSKRASVTVRASEDVKSVVGRVLTLPSSTVAVSATAKISGTAKLCLLTLDTSKGKVLTLDKDSQMTANGCAIQSNSKDPKGLSLGKNAQATAASICSAGGVENKGAVVSPSPLTDCPVLGDPLAARQRPSTGACLGTEKRQKVTASTTLYPGTYCQGLEIADAAQVTLAAGIYVISNGPLIVGGKSSLSGTNVGFYFNGDAGGMRLDPETTVSLTAPKEGDMAGLLMFEDRTVSAPVPPPVGPTGIAPPPPPLGSAPMREYRITSNNVPNLLGTIYLPAGRLIVDAKRPVADKSAYTVVVARQIDINSGPNLVLNSDYGATDVPVPDGVGPKTGNVSLSQ